MATKSLATTLDTLGTATRVGNFSSDDPQWHELRKTGIGGSDIAAICKASPWTSPFKLWAVKTGRLDDNFVPSEAAEWGNRLEPIVIDKFAEEHPDWVIHRNVGTYRNADRAYQLANPDAIYELPDGRFGIIEVKTSRFEDDWANGVPLYYQTQVQWYASAFGFKTTIYVVALFAGSKYRVFEVEPDEFEQSVYIQEVESFLGYVEADKQPDFDGSMSTYETVRELHPEISDCEVELADVGGAYLQAQGEFEQAEANFNESKSRVLDKMGDAKRGLIDGVWRVTRQARGGGKPFLVAKKN